MGVAVAVGIGLEVGVDVAVAVGVGVDIAVVVAMRISNPDCSPVVMRAKEKTKIIWARPLLARATKSVSQNANRREVGPTPAQASVPK